MSAHSRHTAKPGVLYEVQVGKNIKYPGDNYREEIHFSDGVYLTFQKKEGL